MSLPHIHFLCPRTDEPRSLLRVHARTVPATIPALSTIGKDFFYSAWGGLQFPRRSRAAAKASSAAAKLLFTSP